LGEALAMNQSVKKLCLKNCRFIDSGLGVLFLALQHSSYIRGLALLSCDLSDVRDSDVVSASLRLMKLHSFVLVNSNLSLEGLRFLCQTVKMSPDLREIDLSRNDIGPEGILLISDGLATPRHHIRSLILSGCRLDAHCVKELAKGIGLCSDLVHLDL